MSQWFQRMTGSGRHGEMSDATIQGYLRSASQLEDIWQQLDDKVDALILGGLAPWEAYAQMGYALAFVRACRMVTVCVQELLKANALANPAMPNALPRVTYEQALALCQHIEPFIEEAMRAATSPHYIPHLPTFPLAFGPFVGDQQYPLSHLQGFLGAAQQMRDWTAGLLAKYELALHGPKTPLPQAVATHLEAMNSTLGLGDFHLRTGVDMAGQISKGPVPDELSAKAIGFLWEAMDGFFRLSQVIAFPVIPVPGRPQQQIPGVRGTGHSSTGYPPGHTAPGYPQHNTAPGYPQHNTAPGYPQGDTPTMDQGTVGSTKGPMPTPPPEPDVTELLNQVIANPGATRTVPTSPSPSPDISNMFNQVIANTGTGQETVPPAAHDVVDLLSQVIASPEERQNVPTATAAKESTKVTHESRQQGKATPEDDILRMLSNISGEQQNNDPGKGSSER